MTRFTPSFAIAFVAATAVSASAFAGPGELSPTIQSSDDAEPFSGSIMVGYDSAYVLRGARFGDHAPWSEIDLYVPLKHGFSLNIGTWYINPTRNASVNDELDCYGFLCYAFDDPLSGLWEFEVGGLWAGYLEDDADETEVSFKVTKAIGDACDFVFDYVYDITYSGQYFGYSVEKTISLSENLNLELSGGISHANDRYTFEVVGGEHVFLRAGMTRHLTETVDLGAYMLQNWPFGKLADAGEESGLYGGASCTVSF